MKKLVLITMACTFCMMACNNKKTALTSGIDKKNMDLTVLPTEDFYQYACGGWIENHPLTAEYSRFSSFDELSENNKEQLRELISGLAAQENKAGSIARKIGDFYNLGMNTEELEKQGVLPVQEELHAIVGIRQKTELTGILTKLGSQGIFPLLQVFGEADPGNSRMMIAWFHQSGLGIGDRDYYLQDEMQKYREGYATFLTQLLILSGYGEMAGFKGEEAQMAQRVLAFEKELAQIFINRNELRDPNKTNNITSVDEFQKMVPVIDIKAYLEGLGLANLNSVNLASKDYFAKMNGVVDIVDIEVLKAYLATRVINAASPYLNDALVNANFDFYGKVLSGKEAQQPRWKRVITTVDRSLGEAVGQMYVAKYFPAESKERMLELVKNLELAMGERIRENTWMTSETKEKALEKLATFHVKIGYPERWRDYSGLAVEKDSYYANVKRAKIFNTRYELDKIGKEVNKEEWLITPQTVNAYYNPTTNEICFPAGILQPPFFNKNADDAVNYGAIGMVIGHEMTHGFDDQGGKYDKDGNLSDWWTENDTRSFDERKQVLIDYFNNIVVLEEDGKALHADGQFTLGENIADNGGVKVAYLAMQKAKAHGDIQPLMDGFTAEQRFFISYAQVWAGNIRDTEIIRRTKEDPHSLGKWRVNGTLPHVNAFIEAFDVKEENPMYLAPEKRAEIW